MTIRRIEPGARSSRATVHNNIVYLGGLVGTAGKSIEEQTSEALDKAERILAEAGSDKSRILRATIWLSDRRDFDGMNSVWDKWIAGVGAPARATGEVMIMAPGYRVEIILTAAV